MLAAATVGDAREIFGHEKHPACTCWSDTRALRYTRLRTCRGATRTHNAAHAQRGTRTTRPRRPRRAERAAPRVRIWRSDTRTRRTRTTVRTSRERAGCGQERQCCSWLLYHSRIAASNKQHTQRTAAIAIRVCTHTCVCVPASWASAHTRRQRQRQRGIGPAVARGIRIAHRASRIAHRASVSILLDVAVTFRRVACVRSACSVRARVILQQSLHNKEARCCAG